jgi:hypothetical protein
MHKDQQQCAGSSQNHVDNFLINVTALTSKFCQFYKSKSIEGDTGER